MRTIFASRAVGLALSLAAAALAGEPAAKDAKVTPELAPDPRVMEIINKLADGESAVLPPPKVTGDINDEARRWELDRTGPGGRDYCVKMVWMPDRKRAAYCGANHYTPHRLNDIWEYDLPSNTWVCLYGPDKTKNEKEANWDDVTVDENGIFRCKRGGPANIGHTWWQLTYDPEKKALLWLCNWGIDPPFATALREKLGGKLPNPPLWLFYPCERKWEPVTGSKLEGAGPKYFNASALEYVPELKASVWSTLGGTWAYDSKANSWKDLKPNGGTLKHADPQSHAYEGVTVYVPSRKIVVSAGTNRPSLEDSKGWTGRTNVYSVEANAWKKVAEGADVPWTDTAKVPFVYDSTADVCLLYHDRLNQFWAFDIDAAKWSRIAPKGPEFPQGVVGPHPRSCYDPERNVWVVMRGNMIWVYRHKARPAAGK